MKMVHNKPKDYIILEKSMRLGLLLFFAQVSLNCFILSVSKEMPLYLLNNSYLLLFNLLLFTYYAIAWLNRKVLLISPDTITVRRLWKRTTFQKSEVVQLKRVMNFNSYIFLLANGTEVKFPGHYLRKKDRTHLHQLFTVDESAVPQEERPF